MAFFSKCVDGVYRKDTNPLFDLWHLPLVSADYNASEPFGYIMMGISGLLIIYNFYAFMNKFLFKPKQHFLWAFTLWGLFIYLFQLSIVINNGVGKMQMVIAVLHNLCELYMTYWNYLAIRNYIKNPLDNKVANRVKTGDKAVLWTFSILAAIIIISQMITILLFDNMRYGVYAFYFILFGDSFFIATSLIAFILALRRKNGTPLILSLSIFLGAMGHIMYASNSFLMCYFPVFTVIIALLTNTFSITWISICLYASPRISDSEYDTLDHIPDETFLCSGI